MRDAARRAAEFLESRVGDDLRSVIYYEPEDFEVVYIRSDVAALYDEEDLSRVMNDARIASVSAPYERSIFPESNGELQCTVRCFENVTEFNFVRSDGTGLTVSLEAGVLGEASSLVGRVREEVRGEPIERDDTQSDSP
jgi:hypothetical protein